MQPKKTSDFECRVLFGSGSGSKKVGFFPWDLCFRVPEPITSCGTENDDYFRPACKLQVPPNGFYKS